MAEGFITRRCFASGVAATILGLGSGRGQTAGPAPRSEDGFLVIEPRPDQRQIRPEPAARTPIWGYEGITPGPVLRVRKGERLKVRLKNGLAQPTSIHWHGVRIANAMDGAAGLTQQPVPPGGRFDYDFVAPDAGTFWYHPHVHGHTGEQLDRGLAGVLIVEEPVALPIDRDLLAVLDDWRLNPDHTIDADFAAPADMVHGGRLGNVMTVNGKAATLSETHAPGSRIRLRLINVANSRIFNLKFEGVQPVILAVDGQPATPFSPKGGVVALPPGGRFDILLELPRAGAEPARVVGLFGETTVPLVELKPEGPPRPPHAAPVILPANALPERIDLARARRYDLLMEGGVDPANHGPDHMRMMMNPTQAWTFNKVSGDGHSGAPLFSVKRGTSVVISMINRTAWPHAMHLHGHHFRTLFTYDDGWDPFWLDSALIEPNRTLRCAFVADNPGKWMLHCHMIEHQAAGMATWFEVT